MAKDVADALGLERVLWIPAGEPPHKLEVPVSPAPVRLAMVRAACEADPRFEACSVEVERPGPSFMVDTVKELTRWFPGAELFLIVGADEFRVFDSWRDPDQIVRFVRLAVMDRAGASAVGFRDDVPGGRDAEFVPVRRIDVSASEVRGRVRRGENIDHCVPDAVRAIIEREGLYLAP